MYLSENYRKFFIDLAPNNNSEWFNINRKRYEIDVKVPFNQLVAELIIRLAEVDKNMVGIKASDCIFRINRDIRFSKDKTPYKPHMSAAIAPGGKKNFAYPGFYFEATPEGINIYGGVYVADKGQLEKIRNLIAENLEAFNKLLTSPDFKNKYGGKILGETQIRIPKELKEAADKQPLIYNKQFYYKTSLDESYLTRPDLLDVLVDYFKASQGMNTFLKKAL